MTLSHIHLVIIAREEKNIICLVLKTKVNRADTCLGGFMGKWRTALLVSLTSCAALPTTYIQEDSSALVTNGYRDFAVGSNKFIVGFRGNSSTRRLWVERYAFQRAQEKCVEQGFTSFDLISKTDLSSQDRGSPSVVCYTNNGLYNLFGLLGRCRDSGGARNGTTDIELLITCQK
jgi:hypothetical protein